MTRVIGFGTIANGNTTGGPIVDLAACLRPPSSSNCVSAAPFSAIGTVAGLSTSGAPTNLVASVVGSTVTLAWTAPNGGDPVSSYVIEAGTATGLANLASFSTGNASTVFHASGIGAGSYYVRVRSANAAGASAPSNEILLVVGGSPGVPPGAPTGLTNTVNTGGTVGFAWNPASGSPTSYVVEAGSQSGLANLANSDLGSAATAMTATGVGGGTYYVRVRAKNGFGISGPSNEVVLTVAAAPLGCNPALGTFVRDFFGVFSGTVPVGSSSGRTVSFSFREASYSEAAFEGFYVDAAGQRGSVRGGYTLMYPTPLRMTFFFLPDFTQDVVGYGAIFRGDPSACSGNTVLAVTGDVHMGYQGGRACQPGETCPDGILHFTGPGFPMTLTRQ